METAILMGLVGIGYLVNNSNFNTAAVKTVSI